MISALFVVFVLLVVGWLLFDDDDWGEPHL